MGKARRLKKLRRELEKYTDPAVKLQGKQHIVQIKTSGQHITHMTIRHDPNSRKGLYKQIKKQGDFGEDE